VDHIEYLERQISAMEKEMLKFIQSHSQLDRNFRLLTSIIGVGQTTAVTYLGELSAATHFASGRQLEVFCGIAPRLFESGSSVRSRTKMSKVGNSRIRKALYMPAVAALRSNPALREFALRLKAKGKPGKVVVCAVMRKLLRIMFAVLKSGKPFDVEFKSQVPVAIQAPIAAHTA
jgi:transposase